MNVLHLLHTVGEAYSEETAVASVDGELTYEELYERVDRYAAALRTHLEPGDRFSLFMGNSNRMLSVLLAGWQMGALPAPINTRLGVDEIAGLIEDAGARFVVVDEAYADRVDESVTPEGVPVYRSSGDGDGGHAGRFEAALPEGDVERCVRSKLDTEEAMFLHSAGTTGRPKWVRITHGNLAGSLGPMVAANLDADDVGLHYYPLYHSGGIDMTLCRLLCGATTVIGRGWDAEDALERIERHGANGITVVPQMGYELAHHDAVEDYDLSTFRYLLVGSDTLSEELAGEFRALGVQPMQAYGLTETMAVIAISAYGDEDCPLDSTGRVIEDVARVRIVDPQTGEEVPSGEIGEILVAGDKLAPGYHERPDADAEAFEDGWLHTDDLGSFDENGYLHITGRFDNMLIVGGENVYPTDVEETLAAHPSISQVVVVGAPDERKGEIPVANVVLQPGSELTESALQEWFIERDAAFKHPRIVRFVDELPKTALGKIDRGDIESTVRREVGGSDR